MKSSKTLDPKILSYNLYDISLVEQLNLQISGISQRIVSKTNVSLYHFYLYIHESRFSNDSSQLILINYGI